MVWKKTESEPIPTTPSPAPPRHRTDVRSDSAGHSSAGAKEVATIGPSISIKGDLSGKEDLLIQGRVEGNIELKQNNVTVGQEGKVRADIHGRSIRVEGEVHGNLFGQEDVVIRQSGAVQGNILAPRVTLENGSKFKGSIDMEPAAKPAVSSQAASGQKSGQKKGRDGKKPNGAPSKNSDDVTVPPDAAQAGLQLDKTGAQT